MASSSQSAGCQRRRRSLLPADVIEQSIANSISQIICNMTNSDYQERCRQMLQIDSVADAENRILQVLKQIDEKSTRKRPARKQ